ncbi:MAG TPA: DUF6460 domain-containing protein [Stellaceae bacterium]|nr:DUF6460 domain-containing protein [Stellaceae bacterium]
MGTIIRLLLLCLVVGLILAFFNITPQHLFNDTIGTIRELVAVVTGITHWAAPYVVLGAVVVIPIAILSYVFSGSRR